MVEVRYPNGVVLHWDDTITVGSLITAYHKGYHIVTSIDWRKDETPLFTYSRVDGPRRTTGTCDASYCVRITREMIEAMRLKEINAAVQKAQRLLDFVE